MPGDAVLIYKRDEIPLRVTCQGGFGEMRVLAQKVFGRAVDIGKVAPPPAGDADFLARCLGMIDDQHISAHMGRAHHACGT